LMDVSFTYAMPMLRVTIIEMSHTSCKKAPSMSASVIDSDISVNMTRACANVVELTNNAWADVQACC